MSKPTDKFSGLESQLLDLGKLSGALSPTLAALGGLDKLDQNLGALRAFGKLSGILDPLGRIDKLGEKVRAAADPFRSSAMEKITRRIADQHKAIANLRRDMPDIRALERQEHALSMPEPPWFPEIPPDPAFETNERLAALQERLDRMEKIALDSAAIATGLQESAATFLTKFEEASKENARTTKRAVRIGVLAIVIATLTAFFQIGYTELYRSPADTAANEAAIAEMKKEILGLQEAQKAATAKLSEAISQNGDHVVAPLKEIRDLLARPRVVFTDQPARPKPYPFLPTP